MGNNPSSERNLVAATKEEPEDRRDRSDTQDTVNTAISSDSRTTAKSGILPRRITEFVTEEVRRNGELASAKGLEFLLLKARGTAKLEQGSVYGAVVLLPQIARTAGWTLHYTALAVRSFIFLLINFTFQGFLLYMISKEERINERFGGQMHLCNFGVGLPDCPDTSDCIGPTGTIYQSERIKSWHTYNSRLFLQTALISMFPGRTDEIKEHADPGEYGLESYWVRLSCIFVFILGQWQEIVNIFDLVFLLWGTPSCAEPWMSYAKCEDARPRRGSSDSAGSRRGSLRSSVVRDGSVPRMSSIMPPHGKYENRKLSVRGRVSVNARRSVTQSQLFSSFDQDEFESVTIKIAGMPVHWKLVNIVFVVFPRLYLWILMLDIGHIFLMETASIEDMVMNAVSLFFILSIDEVIYTALFGDAAHELLHRTENLQLWEVVGDLEDDDGALSRHQRLRRWTCCSGRLWLLVFPSRLFFLLALVLFFQMEYYFNNCTQLHDGSTISSTLFRPKVPELSLLSFLFGPFGMFGIETTDEPLWEFVNNSA